jgi:hypothetical protein
MELLVETYQKKLAVDGLKFKVVENTSAKSVYTKIAILTTKGRKKIAIKAFITAKAVHILPWEKSDKIVKNLHAKYTPLIQFWIDYAAEEKIPYVFAKDEWWDDLFVHPKEPPKTVFEAAGFGLIAGEAAAMVRDLNLIDKNGSGWFYGEIKEEIKAAHLKAVELKNYIQTLDAAEPLNSYKLFQKKIQYAIAGEKGTIDFSVDDQLSYETNNIVEKIGMEPGQPLKEALGLLFHRIKAERRIVNLYHPPTEQFDCLARMVINEKIKQNIYDELFGKLKDWEQVELFCLDALLGKDYSKIEREGFYSLRIVNTIYLFDQSELFEVYPMEEAEMVMDRFENLAVEQFQKTTRHAIYVQLKPKIA